MFEEKDSIEDKSEKMHWEVMDEIIEQCDRKTADMLFRVASEKNARESLGLEPLCHSILLGKDTKGDPAALCPKCKKGYYRPLNPKASHNYCYVCNNCGSHITVEPNLDII